MRSKTKSTRLVERTLVASVAFLLATAVGAQAFAQQEAPQSAADEAATQEASEGEQAAQQQEQVDPDDPMYWSKVRKVQTVQKREFQKVGRFSATVYGGIIPNNIFEQYFPVGMRLNYYILENIGLELSGNYSFSSETSLSGTMSDPQGINASNVRIGDSQLSHVNFGVVWSPFYGKTTFHNDWLNYLDMYLVAGAGVAFTQTQPEPSAPLETSTNVEGVLGAGIAYYFADNAVVRADYRQFIFQSVIGGVANPSEASLGLGWFF